MNHSTDHSAPTQPPVPASHPEAATLPPRPPPQASEALTNEFVPGQQVQVMDLTALPQLPGYEILKEVGRGGMGVVYQAKHLGLGRTVALKMILAGPFADAGMLARFRAEAEALAKLQHPHIVQVYDIGAHEGKTFFSLEYVAGGSLDRFLKATPQPPHAAAALIAELADAIQAAHQAGIVHRDLKPANVLLSFSRAPQARAADQEETRACGARLNEEARACGARLNECLPKITDFGLAKQADSQEGLTATGAVMGTPSYMAPEQAEGQKGVGAGTDIYALGAILYEMLTGRPPFKAPTPLDTIMQVVNEEPVAPGKLQPGTPKDVETICLKCLQKDPAKRYATAAALAADLRRFLNSEPIIARPVSSWERAVKWARRRPSVAGLLAALVVVVAAALVSLFSLWQEAEGQRQHAVDSQGEAVRRRNEAEQAQRLAEARAAALKERVYAVDMMQALDAWNLADLEGVQDRLDRYQAAPQRGFEWYHHRWVLQQASYQRFAPDAQPIPFAVDSIALHPNGMLLGVAGQAPEIQIWNVPARKLLRRLPVQGPVRSIVFGARGWLLTTQGGQVEFWNVLTGQRVRTLKASDRPLTRISLSRDGRKLAALDEGEDLRIWELSREEPPQKIDQIALAVLHPDGGHYGVHLSNQVRGIVGTVSAVVNMTDPQDVHAYPHTLATVMDMAFSANGQRFAVAGADPNHLGEVRVYDVKEVREVCRLGGGMKAVRCVAFSANGRLLATGSDDNTVRVWEVKSGKEVRRFRGLGHRYTSLAFTKDGKKLLAGSRDAGVEQWPLDQDQELHTLDLKVTSALRSFALHPDGDHFLILNLLTLQLAQYDTAHDRPRHAIQVTTDKLAFGQCLHSPDGHLLALGYRDGTVRLADARSGKPLRTLEGLKQPVATLAFSPDSSLVVAVDATPAVVMWEVATGRVRTRLENQPLLSGVNALVLGPHGEYLLSGHANAALRRWDLAQGKLTATFQPPGKATTAEPVLMLDPQGRRLALTMPTAEAAADLVQVLDAQTGERLFQLSGHAKPVTHLAFSPDGLRLASGSTDGTVRLWDMRTGQEVLRLRIPEESLADLRFTADGQRLQALGRSNWVRTWSAPRP